MKLNMIGFAEISVGRSPMSACFAFEAARTDEMQSRRSGGVEPSETRGRSGRRSEVGLARTKRRFRGGADGKDDPPRIGSGVQPDRRSSRADGEAI